MPVEIWGPDVSQPTRAVLWLLALAGETPEMHDVNVFGGETRSPEFRALSPAGTVPVMRDGDVVLGESHAIMWYLCQRLPGLDAEQWYPTADLAAGARVRAYLNWHHSNARLASGLLFRPKAMQALGVGNGKFDEKKGARLVGRALATMDTWLGERRFLCTDAAPTVADLSAYCEVDQLEMLDLFDFSAVPNVQRWMAEMKAVPHHDAVRTGLRAFCAMLRSNL